MVIRIIPLLLVCLPGAAFAIPTVGAPVQSTTAIINRIINSTPGLNTITTTGTGVTVRAAASTSVGVGRGVTVAVPTIAETAIGAGRIAGVAARAIKWGSWVGVASIVIPWLAEQSGVFVCPAPNFFCTNGPDQPIDPIGQTGFGVATDAGSKYAGTGQGACNKYYEYSKDPLKANWQGLTAIYRPNNAQLPYYCVKKSDGAFKVDVAYIQPTCPPEARVTYDSAGLKQCVVAGPQQAATETELGSAIEGRITSKADRVGQLYSAETGSGLAVMNPTDLVTVTPTPVSTPTTTKTYTVNNPDGTTSTIKEETKSDVKPVAVGTNLGNTSVSYPTTTTTTTTTTNNNTNVSTVNTTVINNYGNEAAPTDIPIVKPPIVPDQGPAAPGAVDPSAPQQIPTDYNREVTQQKILQQLDVSTVPADPADQGARTTTEVGKTDKSLDDKFKALPGELTSDKANWFSWVWTPPVGECSASMFTGSVHGYTVNWDICFWAGRIREVLGWLFALFGALNIYSNLFRRGND